AEAALIERLEAFAAFGYSTHDPRYPFELPGISTSSSPPENNTCCTFVEALLVRAWADETPGFLWSTLRHRQFMVLTDDLYGPVSAAVQHGMASRAGTEALPAPWTIVQGWRADGGGHTFLVLDVHEATGRVLTLESNKAHGLLGVGYRSLGNLDALPGLHPGADWHTKPGIPTWAELRTAYPDLQAAALHVDRISWVSGGRTGLESTVSPTLHDVVWERGARIAHHPDCAQVDSIPVALREHGPRRAQHTLHDCVAARPWGARPTLIVAFGADEEQQRLLLHHAAPGVVLVVYDPPPQSADLLLRCLAAGAQVVVREVEWSVSAGIDRQPGAEHRLAFLAGSVLITTGSAQPEDHVRRAPAALVITPGSGPLRAADGVVLLPVSGGVARVEPAGRGARISTVRWADGAPFPRPSITLE
ncbi:MAG: hypothetical protein ACI9K2_003440, partial [Myxococcota bacterium]